MRFTPSAVMKVICCNTGRYSPVRARRRRTPDGNSRGADRYYLLISFPSLQAERSNHNKRSDVALSGVDWEEDADHFSIIGFIPQGCFFITGHQNGPR